MAVSSTKKIHDTNEKINILCAQKSFCAKVAPCRSSTFLKLSVNKAKAKFSGSPSSFAHHTAATSTAHTAGGKAGNPPPCQTPSVAYSFYISAVYATVTFTVWFIQKCRLFRKNTDISNTSTFVQWFPGV